MTKGKFSGHTRRKNKQPGRGNLRSFLAILIGILIASCGILLPWIFFSNESDVLVGRQYTVDLLSSDSVQTVTRDTSFSLDDYAYITEMTRNGALYYSEPTDAQLSMREAQNAAGEILKALLPNVFTGVTTQAYTLSSAILTSNVQASDEDYDYRQTFWYVDITYPDDTDDEVSVSSTINAVNGKAWSVSAIFPLDSISSTSYGLRVADDILDVWGIPSNLFYTGEKLAAGGDTLIYFPVNAESTDESGAAVEEGRFYAEYLTDDGVLVYNATDFYGRLDTAVRTMDGLTDFVTNLWEKYLEYLEIAGEEAEQEFSVEFLYDYDTWYSQALEDCRALLLADEELAAAAAENNIFSKTFDSGDVDTVLLDSDTYAEAMNLLTLTEYPYSYAMDVTLLATHEATGLCVTVDLEIYCDDAFIITVNLGTEEPMR